MTTHQQDTLESFVTVIISLKWASSGTFKCKDSASLSEHRVCVIIKMSTSSVLNNQGALWYRVFGENVGSDGGLITTAQDGMWPE